MPGPRRFRGAGTHAPRPGGLSARAPPTRGSHLLKPGQARSPRAVDAYTAREDLLHQGAYGPLWPGLSRALQPFAPPAPGCELEVSPSFLRPGRAPGTPGSYCHISKGQRSSASHQPLVGTDAQGQLRGF
ncbi:hypothetical protein NN561_005404 [Cricetulus griseus]